MEIQNLLLIMIVVWGTGVIFRKMNLPILLGELLAGLIFGPALFGFFHDNETIELLAELGIFFLMLHAGLETKPQDLLRSSKASIAAAIGGIVLPIFLGYFVSMAFGFTSMQSMFIGVGLSITCVSVTVKIFKDFKFNQSKIAHLVMGAAIADDIAAFVILSILLGVIAGGGAIAPLDILFIVGKVLVFFMGTILIGVKLVPFFKKHIFSKPGHKAFTFTLIIAFTFGWFAELIGLHYILGAYLAGLFLKEELVHDAVFRKIEDRLFGLSYSFLGPIFFVSLGFHVDFTVFTDTRMLLFLILIIIAAVIGKVFGAGFMAYLTGQKPLQSAIIGMSMNGRGAVELIIAIIGLEMGLIDEGIFSVLVLMAFFTTLITPITLKFLLRGLGKKEVLDTEYEGT